MDPQELTLKWEVLGKKIWKCWAMEILRHQVTATWRFQAITEQLELFTEGSLVGNHTTSNGKHDFDSESETGVI